MSRIARVRDLRKIEDFNLRQPGERPIRLFDTETFLQGDTWEERQKFERQVRRGIGGIQVA